MKKILVLRSGHILTVENIEILENGVLNFFNIDTEKNEALNMGDVVAVGDVPEYVKRRI